MASEHEQLRLRGNDLYRAGDHVGAERVYGEALVALEKLNIVETLEHDVSSWKATVLSNRAQARLQLGWLKGAISDCDEALDLDPSNWKARLRKIKALEDKLSFTEAYTECATLAQNLKNLPPATQQLVLRKRSELKTQSQTYKPPELPELERRALFSEHHTLRLFLSESTLPLVVQPGSFVEIKVDAFIGNEFGLLDHNMLAEMPQVNAEIVGPDSVKFTLKESVSNSHGRASLQGRLEVAKEAENKLFQLRLTAQGVEPVLSPPTIVSNKDNEKHVARFESYGGCRELAIPGQEQKVYLLEATSSLGIAGKLWDSASRLLGLLGGEYAHLVKGRRVLELGAGTGAVGIGCARIGASYVAVTDLEEVIPQMEANVVLNELKNAEALPLGWGSDPELDRFGNLDLIVLSDVVYDPELYDLLIATLTAIAKRFPDIQVMWGHRHRNPADHQFFAAFAKLFEAELLDGPGAGFLVPAESYTPELHALKSYFAPKQMANDGENSEPKHSSRDVSIYLCRVGSSSF